MGETNAGRVSHRVTLEPEVGHAVGGGDCQLDVEPARGDVDLRGDLAALEIDRECPAAPRGRLIPSSQDDAFSSLPLRLPERRQLQIAEHEEVPLVALQTKALRSKITG